MFIAKNSKGKAVLAAEALKDTEYWCLECGAVVVLKKGRVKQPHYAHKSESVCSFTGESEENALIKKQISELHQNVQFNVRMDKCRASLLIADKLWVEIVTSPPKSGYVAQKKQIARDLGFEICWIIPDRLMHYKDSEVSKIENLVYLSKINPDEFGKYSDLKIPKIGDQKTNIRNPNHLRDLMSSNIIRSFDGTKFKEYEIRNEWFGIYDDPVTLETLDSVNGCFKRPVQIQAKVQQKTPIATFRPVPVVHDLF